MRQLMAVSAVLLATCAPALAQSQDLNAFGTYPAGPSAGGFPVAPGNFVAGYPSYRAQYPATYSYEAYPRATVSGAGMYYNSGYVGYAPPSVYTSVTGYGPTYGYPSSYAGSGYAPAGSSYATTTYGAPAYGYRRGIFGWRRVRNGW